MCRHRPSSLLAYRAYLTCLVAAVLALTGGLPACNSPSVAVPDLAAAGDDLAGAPDLAAAADLADPRPMDLALPVDLAPSPDLAGPRDLAPGAFTSTLGGIWLVGFSGGLDHFTWIRFNVKNPASGPADFLEATGRPGWVGFWPDCAGPGQWALAQKLDTIQLKFPANCNMADVVLTFQNVRPAMGGFPPGALLEATFDPSPPAPPVGYKYPDKQCDAQFTTCVLP